MEHIVGYVIAAAVALWLLSIVMGIPLWEQYMAWITKNFVSKKKE